MSSSDHRGVPQGNAAIIAAIIGGIALVAAAAIGVVIGRSSDGSQQPPKEVTRIVTVISGNSGGIQSTSPTEAQPVTVGTRAPLVFTATQNADVQEPPPGSIIPAGTGFTRKGISVTLLKTFSLENGQLGFRMKIENQSGQPITVLWKNSFIHLQDDTGKEYFASNLTDSRWDNNKQFLLPNGETGTIDDYLCGLCSNTGYLDDKWFDTFQGPISLEAKHLIFTIDKFAGMENLKWKLDLLP